MKTIKIRIIASGSRGNCYYVDDGTSPVLIEAGIPFERLKVALNYRVAGLTGCLISHEHQDHARSVRHLLQSGVDCYMSTGTATALGVAGHYRLHVIRPDRSFLLGKWKVTPFGVEHDAAEPLGFILDGFGRRLVYVTDTAFVRKEIGGVTHLMLEVNFDPRLLDADTELIPELRERIRTNHMSIDSAERFLRGLDVGQLEAVYLLHLSDSHSNAAEFRQRLEAVIGRPIVHVA